MAPGELLAEHVQTSRLRVEVAQEDDSTIGQRHGVRRSLPSRDPEEELQNSELCGDELLEGLVEVRMGGLEAEEALRALDVRREALHESEVELVGARLGDL